MLIGVEFFASEKPVLSLQMNSACAILIYRNSDYFVGGRCIKGRRFG